MLDRDIVCSHFPKERRPSVDNQLVFQNAVHGPSSLNILLAFKFLSGYSTFGMFISGAEPPGEEMGIDLVFTEGR